MRSFRVLALSLTFTLVLSADVLELKSGERLEGTFKQAGVDRGVVIEVGGQSITIPLAKIRAIYFGTAAKSDAAPSVSAARDSLDALKGLQSVTSSGLSYRDYAPRVLDGKVRVDKYLSGSSEGDAPRSAIRLAMQYYELASTAWGARITKNYQQSTEFGRTLRSDAALMQCPSVKATIADSDVSAASISAKTADTAVMFTGTNVGDQPGRLWTCASAKITEAERLLGPQ